MQPVRGYFDFHANPSINYQLNRLLPGASFEEVAAASRRIDGLAGWKTVMLSLGESAEQQGRCLHASSYYRAAEFYMRPDDPDKPWANEQFLRLFAEATRDLPLTRTEVPYAGGALPVIRLAPPRPSRDVLLVHGGFDSYIEELLFSYLDFPAAGIDVILFEGPGQGQALRRHGLTMDPAWERPVAAVLDHLKIDSCTLMGWSLGGYLAPRAAAFEPRVKRVIANNVLADFLDCFAATANGAEAVALVEQLLEQQRLDELDAMAGRMMAADELIDWVVRHGMAVCGAVAPAGFFDWLRRIRTAPFAHRITQDVLLLAASEDHIVPRRQFHQQIESLGNVASLTAALFTRADAAQSHCHVGNLALVGRYVRQWLELQWRLAEQRDGEPSVAGAALP